MFKSSSCLHNLFLLATDHLIEAIFQSRSPTHYLQHTRNFYLYSAHNTLHIHTCVKINVTLWQTCLTDITLKKLVKRSSTRACRLVLNAMTGIHLSFISQVIKFCLSYLQRSTESNNSFHNIFIFCSLTSCWHHKKIFNSCSLVK